VSDRWPRRGDPLAAEGMATAPFVVCAGPEAPPGRCGSLIAWDRPPLVGWTIQAGCRDGCQRV